jgi:hypothetical protein
VEVGESRMHWGGSIRESEMVHTEEMLQRWMGNINMSHGLNQTINKGLRDFLAN